MTRVSTFGEFHFALSGFDWEGECQDNIATLEMEYVDEFGTVK